VQETVQCTDAALIVMPGDDVIDPNLITHSTVPCQPLINCGATSMKEAWKISSTLSSLSPIFVSKQPTTHYHPNQSLALVSIQVGGELDVSLGLGTMGVFQIPTPYSPTPYPKVGILFYRAHYLAGNTAPIDALCQAFAQRHLQPIPICLFPARPRCAS